MKKIIYLITQVYSFPFWVLFLCLFLIIPCLLLDRSLQDFKKKSTKTKTLIISALILPFLLFCLSLFNSFLKSYWRYASAMTPMTTATIVFIVLLILSLVLSLVVPILLIISYGKKLPKKGWNTTATQLIFISLFFLLLVSGTNLLGGNKDVIYEKMFHIRSNPNLKPKILESLFCNYIPIQRNGKSDILTQQATKLFLDQYNHTFPQQKLTRKTFNQTLAKKLVLWILRQATDIILR